MKTELNEDAICECSLLEAAGIRPEESLLLAVARNLHEDLDVRRVGEPPDQRVGTLPLEHHPVKVVGGEGHICGSQTQQRRQDGKRNNGGHHGERERPESRDRLRHIYLIRGQNANLSI